MIDSEKIRARIRSPRKGSKKVFVPPELGDFRTGTVLSFDQTLTKTGWSLVRVTAGGISVLFADLIKNPMPDHTSFEQTLRRSVVMRHRMEEVVGMHGLAVDAIVHEMPSVQGYRTESSLCGAQALWSVVDDFNRQGMFTQAGPLAMISKQRAYAHLVGVYPPEKRHVTEAVNRLIPAERRRMVHRWNQDIHDSVLNALEYLYDPQERS